MLEVGQDLHDLSEILRVQPFDKGLANYISQKLIQSLEVASDAKFHFRPRRWLTYPSKRLVNNVGVVKVFLSKLGKLFREVSDVYATEWVHLRER